MSGEGSVGESIAIPFIRTKRPHRKSRNGCLTCKRRRVKCDEQMPGCLKCRLRGMKCEYAEKFQPATSSVPSLSTPSSTGDDIPSSREGEGLSPHTPDDTTAFSASPVSPSGTSQSNLPMPSAAQDAEMARYYFDSCVHSLCATSNAPTAHWMWQVFIPSLAYAYPTVRHGMLTLASISLHFFNQDIDRRLQGSEEIQTSSRYMDAAVAHGEEFVANSRQELERLDPSEVDSNTASTRLLAVLAFAFFRHYRQVGLKISDPQAWMWLPLLRGVRTVYISMLETQQDVHPMVKEDMTYAKKLDQAFLPASPHTQYTLNFIRETQAERFDMLNAAINDGTFQFEDEASRFATITAINSLAQVTTHICSWDEMHSLFRALCVWPSGLPESFVHMLKRQDPPAMIVYAHWLMVAALGEELWWVGDMGRSGIKAIAELIPEHSALERPLQLLDFPAVG